MEATQMEVKFIIKARKVDGSEFECFRWCRDAESGIARAFADAKRFNVDIVDAWAEAV
jgi:hypothetical protein